MPSLARNPVLCPLCGADAPLDATLVTAARGDGEVVDLRQEPLLGCRPCLRRALAAGAVSFWRRPRTLLRPLLLLQALALTIQDLGRLATLGLLGPSPLLRRALEEAGIPWDDFLAGRPRPPRRPPLSPEERLALGQAVAVLLRAVAAADGDTDPREWQATCSYLRYFYAEEPEVFRQVDPGSTPLPPPSAEEMAAAAGTVHRLLDPADRRLLLQMLLGIAEQTGGVVVVEEAVLRRLALVCGIPAAMLAAVLYSGPAAGAAPDSSDGDPWRVLGLSPGTPPAAARRRYLELVRENHPDRFVHLGPAYVAAAERRMRRINAAWQALRPRPAPPPR